MHAPFDLVYDSERWIHVPLDYADSPWRDGDDWADWVARTASSGRPDEGELRARIRETARLVAQAPAPHVTARLWHYPTDGVPTGFVDLYTQARTPDGADVRDLLPELGFTVTDPVTEPVESPHMADAVRRLSLSAALVDGRDQPALLAKAEWIGSSAGWVTYAVSADHDVAALESRLGDIDRVFAAVDTSSVPHDRTSANG